MPLDYPIALLLNTVCIRVDQCMQQGGRQISANCGQACPKPLTDIPSRSTIIAVDVAQSRLQRPLELGAMQVVNS